MRRASWAIVVAVGVALAAWFAMRALDSPRGSTEGAAGSDAATSAESGHRRATGANDSPSPVSEVTLEAPGDGAQRTEHGGLLVLLEDGSPAIGAVASWVPRTATDLVRKRPFSGAALEELRARSVETQAGDDGRLRLPARIPGDERGSILWITCRGAEARALALRPGEGPSHLESPLRLAPAPVFDARVVDAAGRPAQDARVLAVRGTALDPHRAAEASDVETARLLVREVLTDTEGRAVVPHLGGRVRLVARHGDSVSAPWLGDAPAEPRLELRGTFTLQGTIRPEDGLVDVDALTILVGAHVEQRFLALASAAVDAQGTYGPLVLPALDAFEGRVDLEGGPFVRMSARLADAVAGEVRRVDFEPRRGVPLPILVVDQRDAPIVDAEVDLAWQSGAQWERASVRSDAQGLALFPGSPRGSVWIEARAPGHVLRRENTVVEARWSEPYRIRLESGGAIRGIVRHRGTPVHEFSVTYWRDAPGDRAWRDFTSRSDGTFAIDGVPLGELCVFATAPDAGRSPVVLARVEAGTVAVVAIDMEGCALARGTIVDALTREPVVGAAVQAMLAHERWALDSFGAPSTSDASGRFSIPCFTRYGASLDVHADGYASVRHAVLPSQRVSPEADAIDLGAIGLERGSRLDITLILPPDELATRWTGGVSGTEHREPVAFGEDGTLRIENLRPGEWTWSVLDPNGGARYGQVHIESSRPTRLVVRADREHDTEIVVVERAGAFLRDPAYVYVSSLGAVPEGESPISAHWIPPSRRITCQLAPGVAHDLVVLDATGAYVGSLRAIADAEPGRSLQILVGEPAGSVRVVDRGGRPLAGVEVHVDSGTGHAARRAVTDAQGIASIGPWPHPSGNVRLARADLGAGYVRGVVLAGNEPTRVEFTADASLTVRCHDGDTPIEGARVLLLAPLAVDHVLASLTTGPDGTVRFAAVIPGDYALRVLHASTWTERVGVTIPAVGSSIDVETRRRGSLVLECLRGQDRVPDVPVQLRAVDQDVSASTWAEQGRVLVRPESGRSDAGGQVRYDGLPRGRYEWSAAKGDGTPLRGSVEIDAGEVERVVIDMGP